MPRAARRWLGSRAALNTRTDHGDSAQSGARTGTDSGPRSRARAGSLAGLRPSPPDSRCRDPCGAAGEAVDPAHREGRPRSPRPGARGASSRSGRARSPARSRARGRVRGVISTSRMWPVSPMPPIVARNSSGLAARSTVRMRPSATRIRSDGDVAADAAVDMVVLAVDVGGDHAAERHELGSGGHGDEPPAGGERTGRVGRGKTPLRRGDARGRRRTRARGRRGRVRDRVPAGGGQRSVPVGAARGRG